ncbi:engulfment and cell motility protein 3 [Ornithorhynchus anatinus]|uniref:Engulfment and cell motility 3 n=1 Tax=Ornithorhynchus anatinus TaxID=9258 RepID=F6PPC4_ORNAN|nr:engulfment and cell motility protein 3 [Ornithorhynchus anatinus]
MAPPRDVVKIAIELEGANPQLIELDQAKPLTAVLKELCAKWNLSDWEHYALQHADGHRRYVTENNRGEIKNGSILCLKPSPEQEVEQLLGGLQAGGQEGRRPLLRRLAALAPDLTFAREFISRDGLQKLELIVEHGDDLGEVLALALRAFSELMEHGVVSWETLNPSLVRKVTSYVNMNLMDVSVHQLALGLLENVVLNSSVLGQIVKNEIPVDRLLTHLQVINQQLQTKAMALLTALLLGVTVPERKIMLDDLWQKNLRLYIQKNIIHSSAPLGAEMAHHLYVLQALSLEVLKPRMQTPIDPFSQEQREQLQSLRLAAFEPDGGSPTGGLNTERRQSLCAREFRKLGFSNSNPAQDLERVPPGLLALDNMLYFARHAPNAYSRFVLENSSREDKHECPFARSSIQLTALLCELLHVGEPYSETAQDFSPLFFGQDHTFHELFCVCIQLLNKTWKEMRATQEDFDKVLQVVREQLSRVLAQRPSSLELFRSKVNALSYGEVLRLRQTERLSQEGTLAPPILELREKLKPDLLELIRQQRLLQLCEGTLFRKVSSRRRQDKLWFCCLSPNHKILHYGDVEEGLSQPTAESLPEKLPVAEMRALLVGRDCPHVREKGSGKQNKDVWELAFSVGYDLGEEETAYLNFIAPSKREFHLWMDGLNALLGNPMSSEQTRMDLELLLAMETKLQLLELEAVPIPDRPPPVPPPPSNFNFCCDSGVAEP